MDLSEVAAGEPSFKVPAHEVIDLLSDDDEPAIGSALVEPVDVATIAEVRQDELQNESEDDDIASESLSLLEDVLEEMGDHQLFNGEEDACTLEEARSYRTLLRTIGPEQFCRETVENDSITAKKLLTAFGIRPPPFLEGEPDEEYYDLLSLALQRELSKRVKLLQYNTIDDAVQLLKASQNIIVLTGAGISTSLGIPDFRSKDVGLYSKLEHLGLADPQDVFDITLFRDDPSIFYTIARDILPSTDRFSPTHAFIRLLQDKGKLLTNYTQNIDNIEAKAGIHPDKIIQCHGSFVTASCVKCAAQVPGAAIFPAIKAGRIPYCESCTQALRDSPASGNSTTGMKRKRSHNGSADKKRPRRFTSSSDSSDTDADDDVPQPGVMKPDITFFGESLPSTFSSRLTNHDRPLVDLVIVIGTSLKVAPVSEVVPYLPAHIPQLYISRTPVSHVDFDVDLLGDCDVVVAELCRRAGWDLKHEMVPVGQGVDVVPVEGWESRFLLRERKAGENEGVAEEGEL